MTAASPIPGVIIVGGNYGSLAAARTLGRHGVPVAFLGDPLAVAAYSRYVEHFAPWRGVEEPDPLSTLIAFGASKSLEGWVMLPSADFEVQLVATQFDRLSKMFCLLTQDWPILSQLHDKRLLQSAAERVGVDFPRAYAADAAADSLTYPVIIKPGISRLINALSRAKAWRIDTAEEFAVKRAEAQRIMGEDGFVVQQLIPGDGTQQLSYAGLWDRGQELRGVTAQRTRQFPLYFGTSPYVESLELPRVAQDARRLLASVGYTGLVEVEFKHDLRDDRLKLLDVNTRIWAWIGLGDALGVDFAYLAAMLAVNGKLPTADPVRYGTAWRRTVPNILSSVQSLMQGSGLGLVAGRSLLGPALSAVFARDDLRPALAEIPVQAIRKARGMFSR